MALNLKNVRLLNNPACQIVSKNQLLIQTAPETDFWQRTYYGFQVANAPAVLFKSDDNFTLTTRVDFHYQTRFDQCGLFIYKDPENWAKASIEFESKSVSRLGSVVTQNGYSDWATCDIPTLNTQWYRLSRRGPDFLFESTSSGENYKQMRIFHLPWLGATSAEMGQATPAQAATSTMEFGLYACSPGASSFTAKFSDIVLESCLWSAHAH